MIQPKPNTRRAMPVRSGDSTKSSPRMRIVAGAVLIVTAAFVAYFPALSGGYLLDDNEYLANCPANQASDGLYRIWCTSELNDYYPVTNTTLWLEWRLWGLNPTGYHVTNLLLHIAAALLLWAVLRKLAIQGSYLAALLFTVHPVNVESVAWIAQRKNTLAIVFFLLSIFWYLRDEGARGERRVGRWYWLSLLAFILAVLSKGSVVILPLVLLLVVWWRQGRISRWDVLRSSPFFLLAAVWTPVIIWFLTHGSETAVRHASFVQRILGAGGVVWFYLSKSLVPINLIFVYPQWNILANDLLWWLPLGAGLGVTGLLIWQRSLPNANWSRHCDSLGGSFASRYCR
jgi:hypothetical protein